MVEEGLLWDAVALAIGLLLEEPAQGMMAIITQSKAASLMARYLYGFGLVCIPFLVGLFLHLIQKPSFSPQTAIIFILMLALVFSFPLSLFLLHRINTLDQERRQFLDQLQQSNQALSDANQELQTNMEDLAKSHDTLATTTTQLHQSHLALQTSNEQLQDLHQELSRLVEDRTQHLTQALAELRERNQELDQYVYKVSHDIRSPVASIAGLLSLIKLETNPEQIQEYLKLIENRVHKLDSFIHSVLTHSKSLNSPVIAVPIAFESIIRQCWEELQFERGHGQVQLRMIFPQANAFQSDPVRLLILFKNLLSNGVRYRNPHVESLLLVSIQVQTTQAIIEVADNGIGIEPEYQERIFEMFFRASQKSDGSGLGLYIVKQVVERMEGTIRVESGVGQGTKFTITLPNKSILT